MKQLFFLAFFFTTVINAQTTFSDFFKEKTLRLDFTLAGNAEKTQAYLSQLIEEPHWGGRQANLDTSLRLGDFLMLLKDDTSDQTIYEEGFATLFEEWQNTEEATKIERSFPNSVIMPYPKTSCQLYILRRVQGVFADTLLHIPIEPDGKEIVVATPPPFRTDTLIQYCDPKNALDIVVLAEGFQENELEEFRTLSKLLATSLMTSQVFEKNKEKINVYAVSVISEDAGADSPTTEEWKNTYFNASFNTLYSERYLMVRNIRKVRDVAALVPYDQIYILVNTQKYGGGGIYNFYTLCSAYGRSAKEVLIHEFGHGFAALADEYYYDDNVLINFIDTTREPWQKNITTLVDFEHKWADMLDKNTPIPTPVEKSDKYPIGVYEGAAYVSKGVYRSGSDCRMKTNEANDFCPVCQRSIQEVIDFITE